METKEWVRLLKGINFTRISFFNKSSVLIPWDTHKESTDEAVVTQWLKKQIAPVLKAYNQVALFLQGPKEKVK